MSELYQLIDGHVALDITDSPETSSVSVKSGDLFVPITNVAAVRWVTDSEGMAHAVIYLRSIVLAPGMPPSGSIAVPRTSIPEFPDPIA